METSLGEDHLPEAYREAYRKYASYLVYNAELMMMFQDEARDLGLEGNEIMLATDDVHVTIRHSTKTEVEEYLKQNQND